ncbi:MAG: 4-carboxymuconolactone decarboxylase [Ilumatobacteraceae bacterium]|nr:4-carboxymuconolactone decarboxylase [Ilumatobacteraceae bacterium]
MWDGGAMSRLPDLDPLQFTEAQERLARALQNRPEVQANGLVGPFAAWMHAPALGEAMAELGTAIRFGASLPASATEVAICTTATFYGSSFEASAHRPLAVRAGVDPDALDRLFAGEDPGFTGHEATAHAVTTELLRKHGLSDTTHAEAVERFGVQGVVELTTTVGYYALNALLLNGFQIPLAPGMDDPLG